MRLRDRAFIVSLTAVVGLLIGWLAWPRSDVRVENIREKETAAAQAAPNESNAVSIPQSAAPKPALASARKPDALLASLRSKLEASNVVPKEALLTFRSAEARDRFVREAAAHGLAVLDTIPQLNAARVRYERLEDLRDSVAANAGDLANVEGNLWLSIPGTSPAPAPAPNNQGGRAPFGYSMLDAINAAGNRTQWGDRVTVAVLDTGVLPHPTFADGQITQLDLVNDGQPFNSHGTSVASIIAGQDGRAPGVAPGAKILDIRVANGDGISAGETLAQGIVTAVDRGAQVINISLGGYGDSYMLAQAVTYATQRGAIVVAAAGNDAYGQLAIPAAYENVLSVGSVDANNRQAYFSNAGAGLDLEAPGVGVVSAWSTDKVVFASGTSQSAAVVSGAVAAYLSWGVLPNAVTPRLKADARPVFNSSGVATGVGILMMRPPAGR
jgi:hypothetical protein